MKLNDTKIKNLKPQKKLYRESDGNGLYLAIKPNGSKLWQFRYTYNKKPNWLGLGVYPYITLKQARELTNEHKTVLAQGLDPKKEKDNQKAAKMDLFKYTAEEWLKLKKGEFAENHFKQCQRRLERLVLPAFGERPIDEIETKEIITFLREIEAKGHLVQRNKVKSHLNQIFAIALAEGKCIYNPVNGISSTLKTVKHKHYDFIKEPDQIAQLLNDIDTYQGNYPTVMALKLAPLVLLRPSELAALEWEEVYLSQKKLVIKAERMKMRKAHTVPLSRQALEIIKDMHAFSGNHRYVFPSTKTPKEPININTLRLSLRKLGYTYSPALGREKQPGEKPKQDTHGFRHMGSTLLYEMAIQYGWSSDIIERQLAHVEPNKVKATYNHAEHLVERAQMLQIWADYLDQLKFDTNVVDLKQKKEPKII
ncbi:tyrosine-type recombinase/integrase [Thiotrichales bacterium 19S9-12]|nr:tyrosine-type recombinase/integrase [Thiotrichales bacterium 19S9-11]MCF6812212.1 tyrosine-type recombinase/integrase [Thiotrichales bacterium 19S9-12]